MLASIIVPVYNSSNYINRCVVSCLSQTYTDIELILIDDGSTDNSLEICRSLANDDDRIILLSQSNRGASEARNAGLRIARGYYIMFVDSDDWVESDMISSMIDARHDYPEAQVIQTRIPGDMKHQLGDKLISGSQAVNCLLEGSWWGPYCKLICRESIGRLRFPDKTISEDYLFNYNLFSNIDNVYYLDKCYYHRTDRPESLSKLQLSKRKFDEFYNVKEVSDKVGIDYPQYKQLADSHLAGTCLKLLFLVLENKAEREYSEELKLILDCIRDNYFSFMKNPSINKHQRVLLASCFSKCSACFAERVYHAIK